VEEIINELPLQQGLQNFPNPFRDITHISFHLNTAQKVNIKVYDVSGREVALLANQKFMESGQRTITWDASQFDSGIYLFRIYLEEGNVYSGKMIVLK